MNQRDHIPLDLETTDDVSRTTPGTLPSVLNSPSPLARRLAVGRRQPLSHALAKLPTGWHSLHISEMSRLDGSFDHLVIGPGGVFVVFSKRHRNGPVRVTDETIAYIGRLMPYLLQAHEEAGRVANELSSATGLTVRVRPVIVFVKTALRVVKAPIDADVVTRQDLHRTLLSRPAQLDPTTVTAILEAVAPGTSTYYAA